MTSKDRLDVIKTLPTMQEVGFPNFEFVIWHELYAPKGTPKEVVDTLNKALQVALGDANVKARFADVGTQGLPGERTVARGAQGPTREGSGDLEGRDRQGRRERGELTALRPSFRRTVG